jgi:hypothetical protein
MDGIAEKDALKSSGMETDKDARNWAIACRS